MIKSDFLKSLVFVKKLSPNWVSLFHNWNEFIVLREWTKQNIHKILNFYENTNFESKPKITHISPNKDMICEEYISWDLLLSPNNQDLYNLSKTMHQLNKNKWPTQKIKDYIKFHFYQKINSVELSIEEKNIVLNFFENFLSLSPDVDLETNRIHADLKGDNILMKDKQIFFIDFEWSKIGHFVEDFQKFVEYTLKYDNQKTDNFINNFYKDTSIKWEIFTYLESFHFFLNKILQLSKKMVSLDDFQKKVEQKINSMINNSLIENKR